MEKKKAIVLLVTCLIALGALGTVPTPVYAQAPPREKTLIIQVLARNLVLDNFNWLVPGLQGLPTHWMVFEEGLFYFNSQTGEYVPWLAEKYEYNDDYSKIKIYLRKTVTWSDGEPFTADDLVFTYNLLIENAPKLGALSVDAKAYLKAVAKIDDYTVELTLYNPDPRFHLLDLMIAGADGNFIPLPKHKWEGQDPLTYKFNPPITTGPYVVLTDKITETSMLCKRRDDWWATETFGIRPAPEYVMFTYMPVEMEALLMSIAANEIDVPKITMGPSAFEALRAKNPLIEDWWPDRPYAWLDPAPRYFGIIWKYPFNNVQVRRALAYLVNREQIVDVALEGGSIPTSFNHVYYAVNMPYINSVQDLLEKYPWAGKYDPVASENIFKELGYKKGADGIWVTDNGTRLKMDILFPSPLPEFQKITLQLADQLRQGGIDAVAIPCDYPTFFSRKGTGDYDGFVCWTVPFSSTDPLYVFRKFYSVAAPFVPIGTYVSPDWNCERYPGNATFDEIIAEWEKTPPTDTAKCMEFFRQAQELYFRDLPGGPAINQAMIPVPRDHYYWTGFPSSDNAYIHPPDWWNCLYTLVVAGCLSPKTGEIVGGIRPSRIDYATVYFTKDMPKKYRAIDLLWYGPCKSGDAVRIPVDDAEYWIRMGYASYSPPSPTIPTIPTEMIKGIATDVSAVKDDVSTLKEDVTSLSDKTGALAGQMTTLTTVAAIEGIAIIVLGVALIIVRRKPT